jgi:Transposase, Mutator family
MLCRRRYNICLLRNWFRYAGRQHYDAIAQALRPVYTAPTEAAAAERFLEFAQAWGEKYPAIVKLWEKAWAEFVPFLAFDPEIRRLICSTNAIESVNFRIRRAVRARGPFPTERAGRPEMRLPGGDGSGPHRPRAETVGHPVEAGVERLRHHLRRKPVRRSQVDSQQDPVTPLS